MTVLVVTNGLDATADYLCARIAEGDLNHVRLNTEEIPRTCAFYLEPQRRELVVGQRRLAVEDIRAVWYRRPAAIGMEVAATSPHELAFARGEWMAGAEGFLTQIPQRLWINHPSRIFAASSKLEQLRRASEHGLTVPDWLCTTSTDEAIGFFQRHSGAVVAKPLYSGYIESEVAAEDTVIYTSRVELAQLEQQGSHLGAPTLFQRLTRGPDVRITMVDDFMYAMRIERLDGAIDVRRDNMNNVRYTVTQPPESLREQLLALVRSYHLRFAAIDMLETRDGWTFLEVNPNGQWAWLDLVAGSRIHEAFMTVFRQSEMQ